MVNTYKTRLRNVTIMAGLSTMLLATAGLAAALPGMAAAFKDLPNAGLLVRMLLTLPARSRRPLTVSSRIAGAASL